MNGTLQILVIEDSPADFLLKERLRKSDTLARLGGDEFVAVLEEVPTAEYAAALARTLIGRLGEPFILEGGHMVSIGTSIGIALFPGDGMEPAQLIQRADRALYQAKARGRGTWCFHDPASMAENPSCKTEGQAP